MRVLILGGAAEAHDLAVELDARGVPVVSSLADQMSRAHHSAGELRVGGFGGPGGLATYLVTERITHVVDATDPFATRMGAQAAAACADVAVALVRLARPSWSRHPNADRWRWVTDHAEACRVVSGQDGRPFLTTGRRTLQHYRALADRPVLVRLGEMPAAGEVPPAWTVLLDQGPFTVEGERSLLTCHGAGVLVTADCGGEPAAKLAAADELGIERVVVRRPPPVPGVVQLSTVPDVLGRLGLDPARP